jgi:N-acetyl-gamma-glutamyl-phosphate reductase
MIKAGIIGGSGYTGEILTGLLLRHPEVNLVWVTSETRKGSKVAYVYPHLNGLTDLTFSAPETDKLAKEVEVVFIALPNGMAMNMAPKLLNSKVKVVDLSADYRFKDAKTFKEWYKMDHTSADLLSTAVYGLPEISNVKGASLVGNPGCYATASILGLYPLVKNGLIEKDTIVVDAKSGMSGAGKALTDETHFANCNDSFSAYKIASHRHTPEIEQALGSDIKLTFTPHYTPMTRGIFATIYAKAKKGTDEQTLIKAFKDAYKGKMFIRILEDRLPQTKFVYGSNYCDIAVKLDKRTGNVIVLSAIDNLMKGASGQALQNMNIMFGLPEDLGLKLVPIYP